MKRFLYILSVIAVLFSSCEQPTSEPERDTKLVLTASADTVNCASHLGDLTALQLTWTAGTNNGTGSAIAYTIDMDEAGNAFAGGLHFEIGRTMDRTLALSHTELADTLSDFFPLMQDDQYYSFELRVRAKVLMTGNEQVSPIVPIVIKRAAPVVPLYLVGDATPNGWDPSRAVSMTVDTDHPSRYTWSGPMNKGEFKILTSTGSWLPCYVRDEDDPTKMHFRETEEDYPDYKWAIPYTGNYTIDVDTKELTIAITAHSEPPVEETYSHIYMIGDATPGGWSWDAVTELSHPEPDIFTYNGTLFAGEIKFPTEIKHDWSGEMIYAPSADCAPTEDGTYDIHSGDPDNKWRIPETGTWDIRIDIKNTKISFTKL